MSLVTESDRAHWITGLLESRVGPLPKVATRLRFADRLGTLKARLGIGRMRYQVEPGLYAVGNPSPGSPVFVSANYKMSFDRLRSALDGRDGWIVVLDTKGINVWCAAGKGTFGTDEIVHRIEATRLAEVASHRRLVVPQLGVPEVSAHAAKKQSRFSVVYGPVRADALPTFLDAGMKATPEMRRVTFPLRDRLVLIPIDLLTWPKASLFVLAGILVVAGIGRQGYSLQDAITFG